VTWGGKVVLMAHGWFMLIVLASYTANLANFLTTANMSPTLRAWSEVQDSFGQYTIALERGSAHEDYINVQRRMWGHQYNITWASSWEDAMALVEDGVVDGTFHDEPMVRHYLKGVNRKQCRMVETGKIFSSFGYGFAFQANNPDFIAFSQAIIYLKEAGRLRTIIDRYIGEQSEGEDGVKELDCSLEESDGTNEDAFHLYDMGGLLYMTALVVFLGFLVNCWERWTHNKNPLFFLQPCTDLCCPQPLDIADDDEAFRDGQNGRFKSFEDEEDDPVPATALTLALSEGVKKGILEAVEKMALDQPPPFTSGMSGIEMLENAGFVDTPRGLLGDVGAAAEKVPGVGLLLGGISSMGTMVGMPAELIKNGGDALSPRRPYSTPKPNTRSAGVSGAVSVDTSDAGSRMGAFSPPLEPKMPKAPRGIMDMAGVEEEDEEDGLEETDETVVAQHRYGV